MLCQCKSRVLVGGVVVAALVSLVAAYPFEVPASACVDMSPKGPGHSNEKPQSSKVPYAFTVEPKTIRSSDTVKITISQISGGPSIAAFMLQVRKPQSTTPQGTFQPEGDNARTVACTSENDTGSHNSPDPKKSVTMIWTPPTNFKGKLNVMATVAETKLKFWTKIQIGSINVK